MVKTRHVAVGALAFFAGFAVWLIGDWADEKTVQIVDDWVLLLLSFPALVFTTLAARATAGRLRAGWTAMSIAVLAWAGGEAIWSYHEIVLHDAPFPSLADAFFLGFPIAAAVAMLFFWNRPGTRSRTRVLLDGVIVAGSLFAVSWLLVMRRLYESGISTTLEFAVLMAYPALDLIALVIASSVLVNAPAAQRRPMTLVTLALVFMWIADSAYAYLGVQDQYASGNIIDLGWVAALLLVAVAGAAGRTAVLDEHAIDEVPGWASVWLPYLPLMLAVGVLATSPVDAAASKPVLVVGIVLVIAVLARQYLVVDQNRRLLAAVADQALRDPLTGLANRALFTDRLQHAIGTHGPSRTAVGVIVLDLDDFKLINDTLGHAAGDELLRATGQRMLACVRSGDTVARLGGDEFAAVVDGEIPLVEATADRIVEAFNQPVVVDGHDLLMRPSVGLAILGTGDAPVAADDLVRRADLAMYSAKRSRSTKVRTYTAELAGPEVYEGAAQRLRARRASSGGAETVKLFGELRQAIDRDELTLVYQPKFALATRSMVGFEALLRWPHPERGLLPPDEFLPLVRQHGLTTAVTVFVLNRSLDDARAWHAAGIDLPVAVNLFPPSLVIPELPQRIDRGLAERGLPPSALTVEITEDLVLGDIGLARQVLLQLRERGITVAIDDFGSGYSALWYLRDLPVDEVKLDRNFIAPIAVDPRGAAVVRAVIDLARVLGIATVAEGVEDEATEAMLRAFGCDMVQGYYLSPPMSAAEILASGRDAGSAPNLASLR